MKVQSFSFSDILVSRHDDQESDFEGFPDTGTCSETFNANRRISVLQAARRHLLVEPVGSAFLSLPACSLGLSPYEVSPAVAVGSVGLPKRVSISCLDTLKCVTSVLAVRRPESSRRGFARAPSPRSSICQMLTVTVGGPISSTNLFLEFDLMRNR